MMKLPEPRHHWLTAVFASLAAVVIPALIYQFLIYGRQHDARLSEAARAVAEVESEISVRIQQLQKLLERRPEPRAEAALQKLEEWLESRPTPAQFCGSPQDWPKIRQNLVGIEGAEQWPESINEFLAACEAKSRKSRALWEVASEAAKSFVRSSRLVIQQNRRPDPTFMEAIRATPGFDRIKVSYEEGIGCPKGGSAKAPFRNFVIRDSQPLLRVVACLEPAGAAQNRTKEPLTVYAEVPFCDVLENSGIDRGFAGLWLLDENGVVLARRGAGIASSIGSVDLMTLLGTSSTVTKETKEEFKSATSGASRPEPSSVTVSDREERRGAGGATSPVLLPAFRSGVDVGGTSHEVFLQQLSLSFVDIDGAEHTLYLGAAMPTAAFRSDAMRMRVTVLGVVLVGLVLAVCGLPYLRILFIGPLEEIRTSDILGLMIGVVAGSGILTIAALSTLAYRGERLRLLNLTEKVARSMRVDFDQDLRSLLKVLVDDADEQVRRELGPEGTGNRTEPSAKPGVTVLDSCDSKKPQYEFSMLLDEDGRFLRMRNCRQAPLVPEPIPTRTYFRRIADGHAWTIPAIRGRDRQFFVERIRTLDHGNKNTVLSLAVAPGFPYTEGPCAGTASEWRESADNSNHGGQGGAAGTARRPPIVAAMFRAFEVFWQRPMPGETGFAVVEDATGRVLYHSTDRRSLVENFFEETSHNRGLRAALESRREASGQFIYRGESVVGAQRPLPYVPWTLVVFADKSKAAAAAFGAGANAAALFGLYGMTLLLALIVTRLFIPKRPWAWAWPGTWREREYFPAILAMTSVALCTTFVGLRSQGLAVLGILSASPVLVLGSLFLRLDSKHASFKKRHLVAKMFLLAAVVLFVAAAALDSRLSDWIWDGVTSVDGPFRDAWDTIAALIMVAGLVVWAFGSKQDQQASEDSMGSTVLGRCYPYAIVSVAVVVALSVPPAMVLFADSWDQTTGRLALLRARETAENLRRLDEDLAREDRRVSGVRSGFDRDAVARRQSAWRQRWDAKDASGSAFSPSKLAYSSSSACAAPSTISKPCEGRSGDEKCLRNWTSRSVQGLVGRVISLLPIEFSQDSAQSRNIILTSSDAGDGWGWRAHGGIFGWCLTDLESGISHGTAFRGTWWREWRRADPVGAVTAGLSAIALLIIVVLVVESLLRRVFVLDLAPPLQVINRKTEELPPGSRIVLIDPPLEELQKLGVADPTTGGPASEGDGDRRNGGRRGPSNRRDLCVISATRFLADDAGVRTSFVPEPEVDTLVVRDLEILLVDPTARGHLLELLERFMEDPEATVVLTSDVFPSEWLAALDAAHGEADRAGLRLETSNAETGDGRKGEAAAVAKTHAAARRATEILRWSDLLARFEKRNFRASPREPNLVATVWNGVDDKVRSVAIDSCSWSEDLRHLAERFRPPKGITPAQMEHELAYRAAPFYRKQWNLCTSEEQLVLVQLAAGNLPNPRNLQALQSLLRRGLIRRDPGEVVLVSDSFASFIRNVESPQRLAAMRREVGNGVWAVVRVPLLLTLAMAIGFVAYVSREAIDVTVGVVGSMAALLPVLARLLTLGGGRLSSGAGDSK